MCAGMLSTRTTHLTWKAARASFCARLLSCGGQGPMNQMSRLQLPHQSCFGMRVYLSVAYSNKGRGPAALFRQDPSTIVGLRGWPPAPIQAALRCRRTWKLAFPFTGCRSDRLLRKIRTSASSSLLCINWQFLACKYLCARFIWCPEWNPPFFPLKFHIISF